MSDNKGKGRFNPKLGNGFTNSAFGEKSIIVNLDDAGIAAFVQNVRPGCAILLKYNKVTSKGNEHYFAELLPPFEGNKPGANKGVKSKTVSDLD